MPIAYIPRRSHVTLELEDKMEPLAKKIKRDPSLKSLFSQSWMLLLGLFWLFRFWELKTEALWLIKLDNYMGDETESLVRVCLARDGMMYLSGALILLIPFFSKVIEHYINKKRQLQPEA